MTKEEYKNEFERRKEELKTKWDIQKDNAIRWIDRNKFFIGLAVGPALALTRECVISARRSSERKAEYNRACKIYDRSSGLTYQLRHPLTAKEARELNSYLKSGYSTFDFLTDYNLLR